MTTEPRRQVRVSARWRIVGWILLPTLIGLFGLVVTVTNAMTASNARESNEDIVQEIEEFRQFVAEGRDPDTAGPFDDTERLFRVYLSRQTPANNELMLARVGQGPVLETRGIGVPTGYDVIDDADLLERLMAGGAGMLDTPVGEIRWGSQLVAGEGRGDGAFAVLVFSQPQDTQVDRVRNLMALVGAGMIVLVAAMGWVVAGQILRPVREVRRAAERISEQDLTRRIPVHGRDDVAELAVQFNAMLARLEEAFATQQRFVDDAGHELRTPITVIRGHLELMGDDPADQAATIDLVTTELDRMSRIVTDLLSLAKAERPDFLTLVPGTDLSELTMDIDAKMQALGDRRWLLTRVAEGRCTVDPQRITQAVLQLAANAVQHTRDGDTVRLASEFIQEDEQLYVRFSVGDDGPGVRPEDAERIFARFARAHDTARTGGAGLGLAIVRAIADSHGGWAGVDSVAGHGATFSIVVPATDLARSHSDDEDEDLTGTGYLR